MKVRANKIVEFESEVEFYKEDILKHVDEI